MVNADALDETDSATITAAITAAAAAVFVIVLRGVHIYVGEVEGPFLLRRALCFIFEGVEAP